MQVDMKNTKKVMITHFHQYSIYSGVMTGMPNSEFNQAIVKDSIEKANERLLSNTKIKVTLIEPKFKKQSMLINNKKVEFNLLPEYVNTFMLNSIDSCAIVVFFSNNFADPVEIKDKLKDLNWNEISQDFVY